NERSAIRIGIAGLSHSHVLLLLKNLDRTDIEIVGIYEADTLLAGRYIKQYSLDRNIVFATLEEMLEKTKPEGVVTFTSIYEHMEVVAACAPRGIHVMVEKPLAVSLVHARAMSRLAGKYEIMILTNYETSWYPSNYRCLELIREHRIGELRKIIVYDGHKGPMEIKVNREFLEWLTDPLLNGGGAVTDFGCYGADLITWIMKGEKPQSVYAVLKQYKPGIYPNVDDDATIILTYHSAVGLINASWNWPFNRKDMHVYGTTGYIFSDDAETIKYRFEENSRETTLEVSPGNAPFTDPFAFFAAAIKGDHIVNKTDLSSLETNVTVVEILEAARKSSRTGREVRLK
ncbi:MAG: Gfo/Idh/MocA family oxidoreductase, partial [Candidatus Atribacteria bacterium]